jgi:hypothetical protein
MPEFTICLFNNLIRIFVEVIVKLKGLSQCGKKFTHFHS